MSMTPAKSALTGFVAVVAAATLGVGAYAVGVGARTEPAAAPEDEAAALAALLAAPTSTADRCDQRNAMSGDPACADLDVPTRARPPSGLDTPAMAVARGYAATVRVAAIRGNADTRRFATLMRLRPARLTVRMLADANRDGLDDDGLVEVATRGGVACLVFYASPNYPARVVDGRCADAPAPAGVGYGYGNDAPKRFPNSYERTV